ncbi:PREDICTED: uncharacterized protein LOC104709391 [Camelina sativa]|uniref:Uncharacterized protein LOC104709391 n=1 Tax=Camelina sativa TaxID=90675 RepID=A0ABM1QD59_CAMSA|nr:PREDICTED: uncharacterized protein LOC104709391 [Camelina sativa]
MSLLFYFLLFLYLHHNFFSFVNSRDLRLASVDIGHVSTISKPESIIGYGRKTPKLAIFIRKGGGGKGGGGRSGGIKGRGGGGEYARQSHGGYPFFVASSHHHANPSSGSRYVIGRPGCGWLGLLSVLAGFVLIS